MPRPKTPTLGLLLLLAMTPLAPVSAQTPPAAPLHLSVTHALTPVTDVLASLSKQSATPILADDTVVDNLGVTTLDKPTLPAMLDALAALTPGLTWRRVTIAADAPLPDANSLSAQVRSLQALTASRLSVSDPAGHSSVSYARTNTDAPTPANPADRTVFLVTNEAVRAQRVADIAAAKKAAAAPAAPVDQAVTGMQTAADDLGRMTPDEQRQAIPLMMQQMMRMMQSIDPGVRAEMGQQWRQQRGAGGAAGQ